MEKIKENAVSEFEKVIKNSWTYGRMTETERNNLWEKMGDFVRQGHVSGSFDQRWRTMQAMYGMFLAGLGNVNNPNWRDKAETPTEKATDIDTMVETYLGLTCAEKDEFLSRIECN